LLYHDVIAGDLFTQVEKTLDMLITKYLRAGISYHGAQRLERLPVPEAALREAVINAIAHKEYGAAIPTQISVYDHKLIIWNAAQLPPDWTLESLMVKHPSQPTNPDIARTLFLAGLIESWGRGIELIRRACVADASPAPKFGCDGMGFWVEFPFPLLSSADPSTGLVEVGKTSVNTSVETPVHSSEKHMRLLILFQAASAATQNVRALNCGEAIIDGVRFLGATMWTDFRLFGDHQRQASMHHPHGAVAALRLRAIPRGADLRRLRLPP